MPLLGLALSLAIGLSLGLLGGGGSILAVPIFVYVLGFDPKTAIAVSLGVVGVVSAAGIIPHARAGRIDIRSALLFAVGSTVGAVAGSAIAGYVGGSVQLVVFAIVMLTAALLMLRWKKVAAKGTRNLISGVSNVVHLLGIALLVGLVTGFVGVGGGFMIVPALVLMADMPMTKATGTSLTVIAVNSCAGFVGYWSMPAVRSNIERIAIEGVSLLLYALAFSAVAIAGVVVGSLLAHRLSSATLRRAFAWFLVVVATAILAHRLGVF